MSGEEKGKDEEERKGKEKRRNQPRPTHPAVCGAHTETPVSQPALPALLQVRLDDLIKVELLERREDATGS